MSRNAHAADTAKQQYCEAVLPQSASFSTLRRLCIVPESPPLHTLLQWLDGLVPSSVVWMSANPVTNTHMTSSAPNNVEGREESYHHNLLNLAAKFACWRNDENTWSLTWLWFLWYNADVERAPQAKSHNWDNICHGFARTSRRRRHKVVLQ